jgi:hypothetical protein
MAENTRQSSSALILATWLVVCIRLLAWGVYFTVLNSMKLFAAVPSGR